MGTCFLMSKINDAARQLPNSEQGQQGFIAQVEASDIVVLKNKLSQPLPLSLHHRKLYSGLNVGMPLIHISRSEAIPESLSKLLILRADAQGHTGSREIYPRNEEALSSK